MINFLEIFLQKFFLQKNIFKKNFFFLKKKIILKIFFGKKYFVKNFRKFVNFCEILWFFGNYQKLAKNGEKWGHFSIVKNRFPGGDPQMAFFWKKLPKHWQFLQCFCKFWRLLPKIDFGGGRNRAKMAKIAIFLRFFAIFCKNLQKKFFTKKIFFWKKKKNFFWKKIFLKKIFEKIFFKKIFFKKFFLFYKKNFFTKKFWKKLKYKNFFLEVKILIWTIFEKLRGSIFQK